MGETCKYCLKTPTRLVVGEKLDASQLSIKVCNDHKNLAEAELAREGCPKSSINVISIA